MCACACVRVSVRMCMFLYRVRVGVLTYVRMYTYPYICVGEQLTPRFFKKSQSTRVYLLPSLLHRRIEKKKFRFEMQSEFAFPLRREMCRYVSCHDVYGERNAGYTASHSWLHTSQHSCQHRTCHHFRCQRHLYQHL